MPLARATPFVAVAVLIVFAVLLDLVRERFEDRRTPAAHGA
jgi:hypothetical protein